jgi:O-antigen ligase
MPVSLNKLTCLLIFILPLSSSLIEHATSTISTLLVLMGLYVWISGRRQGLVLERKEKIIMWAFAAYFFVNVLFYLAYGLFSEHHSLKWNLDHESRMLTFIPIYILCSRVDLKPWPLWYGTAAAAIGYGIYSLLSLYLLAPGERVTGVYFPNTLGGISLLAGFISLAGIRYFYRQGAWLVFIPILAVAGGIQAGFSSGTRVTLLIIPSLLLIFFIQLKTFRRAWLYRVLLISLATVMSVGFYHLPGSPLPSRVHAGIDQAKSFMEGERDAPGLAAVHLGIWNESWKIFKANPLTGIGAGRYKAVINEKVEKNIVPPLIAHYKCPHNMYLTYMTSYGISGLLILLGVFLSPLMILIPAARQGDRQTDFAYAGFMVITAFMLFALPSSIFLRTININIYVILIAVILALIRHHR